MTSPSKDSHPTDHALILEVAGLGSVPSFKNTKKIVRNRRTGVPLIITDPKKNAWMDSAINQFESQLRIAYPIRDGETVGEWQKRLRIVLWQLLDDSHKEMLPGNQDVEYVEKGDEGATIRITAT